MKIDDLKTVLVLGAGTMGSRISLGCALHGYDVIVYDVSEDALKGMEFRHQMMGYMWAEEGKTTQQAVEEATSRIRVCADAAEAAHSLARGWGLRRGVREVLGSGVQRGYLGRPEPSAGLPPDQGGEYAAPALDPEGAREEQLPRPAEPVPRHDPDRRRG